MSIPSAVSVSHEELQAAAHHNSHIMPAGDLTAEQQAALQANVATLQGEVDRLRQEAQQRAADRDKVNSLSGARHLPVDVASWTPAQWEEWTSIANKHETHAMKFCQLYKTRCGECSGAVLIEVRAWLCSIRSFVARLPTDWLKFHSVYVGVLITLTATEGLARAFDRLIAQHAHKQDSRAFTPTIVVDLLSKEFLGKDEQEVLRDELSRVAQTSGEEVSAYCRRYQEAVDMAYGATPTAVELTDIVAQFILGVRDKRIQTKLFEKDIRDDLAAAITLATEEDARWRYRDRVTRKFRPPTDRVEEPMDISGVDEDVTMRERLHQRDRQIKELTVKLQAAESSSAGSVSSRSPTPQQPSTSYAPTVYRGRGGTRKNSVGRGADQWRYAEPDSASRCFQCNGQGHFKRECPQRRTRDGRVQPPPRMQRQQHRQPQPTGQWGPHRQTRVPRQQSGN